MTPETEDPLITERVTSGRRGPLVVLLVIVALVGLLAWKPWGQPVTATPGPTDVAALPTASPNSRPTIASTPTNAPVATPNTAPSPTPTPIPTQAPGYHVGLRLIPSAGATVHCRYEPDADGMANVLSSMFIGETFLHAVLGTPELDIRRVTWRAIVQVNRLETLFSANWETVWVSRRRTARPQAGEEAAFSGIGIAYRNMPIGMTIVARIVVRMEWFGPAKTLLGSDEAVAPIYSAGASLLVEGCHVFTERPR